MYIAELKGKLPTIYERKEDVLTSNVFSFFKYADRLVFLKELLYKLNIKVSDSDIINADFNFWPTYDDLIEPDLIIIIGKYYLLFEMKYLSDITAEQIRNEIEAGLFDSKNLGKELYYIVVTADYYFKNEKFQTVFKLIDENHFRWINWQKITDLIAILLENFGKKLPHYLMAFDLHELLVKMNLVNFQSFDRLNYEFTKYDENIFYSSNTAIYGRGFKGFEEIMPKVPLVEWHKDYIFYERCKK